jgi:phage-related protein
VAMITPLVDLVIELLPLITTLAEWLLDLAVKAIKNIVIPAIKWLIDIFKTKAETVGFVFEKIAEFVGWIRENWDKVWRNVGKFFEDTWNNIKSFAEDVWNNIKDFFSDTLNNIEEGWNTAWDNVESAFSTAWSTIKRNVETGINNVVDWFKALPGRIGTAISAEWNKFVEWGRSIVDGVWRGISNAATWFTDQVKAFFGRIVDSVKNFLGIGSPSKVFADIGKDMVRGMEEGIADRGRRDLVAANLIALIPGSLNAGNVYGQYGMTGAFGTAGGPLVNNNFYAPVGGSMSDFAREVMTEAALEVRFYGAA